MGSLGTCLSQELARFNYLISAVSNSLALEQKAIKGLIVMTGDLDAMFTCMQNNKVPGLWEKAGYPSLKPLTSWFADFLVRVDFFRDWVEQGIPNAYWVTAFFFAQGFLTAVLQGYSRENQIPVDVLSFEFFICETDDPHDVDCAPESGIYIYGMFLDGAKWDYAEETLADQDFGVMYCTAPIVQFVPVKDYKPSPETYTCPLYKTSVRAGTLSTTGHSTNFVLPIEMYTQDPPAYWILKGAALLTMLND
jgi:dynein heavy chain